MIKVGIHEAKTHFSQLINKALAGEEVIIRKGQIPVVRLVPVEQPLKNRVMGQYEGQGYVADDFDAPLPPEILKGFGIE